MPTGIGALTSNMGAQLPPEEVMSSSETISETGVANLPTPNIGQNYQAGGIVYSDGTQGYPVGGLIVPGLAAAGRYLGGTALGKGTMKGLGYLKDKLIGTKGFDPKGPKSSSMDMIPYNPNAVSTAGTFGTRGLLRQPGTYIDTAIIGGITYGVLPNGETEEITEEEKVVIDTNNASEPAPEPAAAAEPEPTMEDKARKRMKLFKEFAGEDEGAARIQERMAKMEERTADVEDQAFNDALITAGLGIAGGRDQNFLTNVAAGGQEGFKSYGDSMDKVRELEKEAFAIDVELNKAKRTEQLAIASKGIDSIEAQEATERASALQGQKDNALMQRVQAQIAATGKVDEGDIMSLYGNMYPQGTTLDGTPMPYDLFRSSFLNSMTSGGVSGNPDSGFGQMTVSE
tara:strand:+ start:1 stop:1203 length:1203 start_codon:yes stop_codon:yes gene_type:complete